MVEDHAEELGLGERTTHGIGGEGSLYELTLSHLTPLMALGYDFYVHGSPSRLMWCQPHKLGYSDTMVKK